MCIDEAEKAPREVQAGGGLLLGNSHVELEGELLTVRPTVYVMLNSGPGGLGVLHEAYVRRSVVIDTGTLRPLLADVDLAIAPLFGGEVAIPGLSLAQIRRRSSRRRRHCRSSCGGCCATSCAPA